MLAGLLALLVGGAIAAVLLARDDGGGDRGETSSVATTTQERLSSAVKLEPVGGGDTGATASARVTGEGDERRLELDVKGLPSPSGGEYGIWLYNSIADAKELGSEPRGSFELDTEVPSNTADYEFLDVSLEPRDGNPNPSGASVLRVPVAELLRR